MSIFGFGFNQRAALHSFVSISRTGDTTYSPALNSSGNLLLCRFDYKRKEALDKDGSKVISEATLFTDTAIKALDVVDYGDKQWTVKSVAVSRNLSGGIDHYEATL